MLGKKKKDQFQTGPAPIRLSSALPVPEEVVNQLKRRICYAKGLPQEGDLIAPSWARSPQLGGAPLRRPSLCQQSLGATRFSSPAFLEPALHKTNAIPLECSPFP